MIKRIVILGGGTAGWMAAARLGAEQIHIEGVPLSITLVEATDIPTIGVGEGTWPSMRSTLNRIGIPEAEFLEYCHASFKQGSRFINWRDGIQEHYDHPFSLPVDGAFNLAKAYSRDNAQLPFCYWASVQSAVIDAGLAPKQQTTPDYAGVLNYGYHLDAGKFAELLKKYAVNHYGVHHQLGRFVKAHRAENGFISAIELADGVQLEADFFIDASGTHAQLIEKELASEFTSLASTSPNNRALAIAVNYENGLAPIASATLSTAQEAGWIWDIGLQHRRGVGYVYASEFSSEDQARSILQQYIQAINPQACASHARLLTINPGYRQAPWVGNCVAIGMASGFIEPLEASALVMVELAIDWLCEHLPGPEARLPQLSARYNRLFKQRWECIVDFLQLHYCLSNRRDTAYWCSVTKDIPKSDRLASLLEEWRYRTPSLSDFGHYMELFPAASYLYVLLGLQPDYYRDCIDTRRDNLEKLTQELQRIRQQEPRYLQNLPSNRAYFESLRSKQLA